MGCSYSEISRSIAIEIASEPARGKIRSQPLCIIPKVGKACIQIRLITENIVGTSIILKSRANNDLSSNTIRWIFEREGNKEKIRFSIAVEITNLSNIGSAGLV